MSLKNSSKDCDQAQKLENFFGRFLNREIFLKIKSWNKESSRGKKNILIIFRIYWDEDKMKKKFSWFFSWTVFKNLLLEKILAEKTEPIFDID
jgi:hypothetical protein